MEHDYQIKIQRLIVQTNQRLRQENIGLKIYLRGQRLYLRGSLPPKEHSSRNRPHQQDLALGYRANPAGITAAYKQAKLIEAQLINKVFDWQDYQKRNLSKVKTLTFQDWILKFEEDFYTFGRSKNKKIRWKLIYPILGKLPLQKVFTLEALEKSSLEIIEACPTPSVKDSTRKTIKQFINFLQREGVGYE